MSEPGATLLYWQWGKHISQRFDNLDEALSHIITHGQPRHANEVRDFAAEEIIDGPRRIRGQELDRLVAEREIF